jgi:hypothetical protein
VRLVGVGGTHVGDILKQFPQPSNISVKFVCCSFFHKLPEHVVAQHDGSQQETHAPAGFKRVLVYKDGSNGWGIDEGVVPYDAYGAHEAPSAAQQRRAGSVDIDEAAAELRSLGIL